MIGVFGPLTHDFLIQGPQGGDQTIVGIKLLNRVQILDGSKFTALTSTLHVL
jgi:hypothetical protein